MTDREPIDFGALEAKLTDPSIPLRSPREVATGAAAARTGQEFLLREYGSAEAIERALIS